LRNEDVPSASEEEKEKAQRSKHQYQIIGGNLIHLWWPQTKKNAPTRFQRVIPFEWRDILLEFYHDGPLGGHFGLEKTYGRMVQEVFWPGMYKEVRKYIKDCEVCEKAKRTSLTTKGPLEPIIPAQRGERINIDLIELDKTHRGNKYALVAVEAFTKFPFAIPIPDKSARTVARELWDRILTVIGIPDFVTSDRGKEFVNSTLKALLEYANVSHLLSTSHHPESNGLVERFNRTLKEGLRKYASNHKEDWDLYIHTYLKSYRDSPHSVTGISPYELLFGMKPKTPGLVRNEEILTQEDWLTNLKLVETHARQEIERHAKKNKRLRDQNTYKKWKVFQPGDWVKVKNFRFRKGAKKLNSNWEGPLEVVEQIRDKVYLIRFLNDPKERTHKVNVENLAEWGPQQVVVPKHSLEVSSIQGHRFTAEGELEFKVSFVGLTGREDKWKTLENIESSLYLKDYLRLLAYRDESEYLKVVTKLNGVYNTPEESENFKKTQATQERKPEKRKYRCSRCKKTGHRRSNCPLMQARKSNQQRVTKTTTSDLWKPYSNRTTRTRRRTDAHDLNEDVKG